MLLHRLPDLMKLSLILLWVMLISASLEHSTKLRCLTHVAPRQYSITIYNKAVVRISEHFSILTTLRCLKLFSTLDQTDIKFGWQGTPIYFAILKSFNREDQIKTRLLLVSSTLRTLLGAH
jgi:hypothetical protein